MLQGLLSQWRVEISLASFSNQVLVPVATVLYVLRTRVRCVMFQSRVSSLTQVVVDADWTSLWLVADIHVTRVLIG